MKTVLIAAGAALGLLAVAAPAGAYNAVVNGGFETTTNGPGEFDYNTTAPGWTSQGYNFIFAAGTGDTTGSYTARYNGYLSFWGPNSGSNNGFTSSSPAGGNFVGSDGAFITAPIQQTINGLDAGKSYVVGFYWAGAQQLGYSGAQTEQWEVSLGNGPSQFTSVYNNPSHGFSGWMHEAFTFTAGGSSQVLSFLAHGTPDGVPPFSLLDGVSLNVPEPATWAMLIAGFGLVGVAARRRRLVTIVAA